MSFTSYSTICIFCCKTTKNSCPFNNYKEEEDYKQSASAILVDRFLKFLDRSHGRDGEGENVTDFRWAEWSGLCEDCYGILDAFCTNYHQMKCLEVQLELQQERLENIMTFASRVPLRWLKLQETFESNNRDQQNVMESENFLESFRRFRRNIINQCTHERLQSLAPWVTVRRNVNQVKKSAKVAELNETSRISAHLGSDDNVGQPEDTEDPLLNRLENGPASVQLPQKRFRRKGKKTYENPVTPNENEKTVSECDTSDLSDSEATHKDQNSSTKKRSFVLTISRLVGKDISPNQCSKYSCSACNKIFQNESQLDTHKLTHVRPDKKERGSLEKSKNFQCSKCDKNFLRQRLLNLHMRQAHPPPPSRPHHCSECGKSFRTKWTLKQHYVGVHKNFKKIWKFQCTVCGRKSKTKLHFNRHMRTHEENRTTINKKVGLLPDNQENLSSSVHRTESEREILPSRNVKKEPEVTPTVIEVRTMGQDANISASHESDTVNNLWSSDIDKGDVAKSSAGINGESQTGELGEGESEPLLDHCDEMEYCDDWIDTEIKLTGPEPVNDMITNVQNDSSPNKEKSQESSTTSSGQYNLRQTRKSVYTNLALDAEDNILNGDEDNDLRSSSNNDKREESVESPLHESSDKSIDMEMESNGGCGDEEESSEDDNHMQESKDGSFPEDLRNKMEKRGRSWHCLNPSCLYASKFSNCKRHVLNGWCLRKQGVQDTKELTCKLCGSRFSRRDATMRHMESVHGVAVERGKRGRRPGPRRLT